MVQSLCNVDPENPGLALGCLPEDILRRMLRFTNDFMTGPLVTNYGDLPAKDQVHAARHWIERSLQHETVKTVS